MNDLFQGMEYVYAVYKEKSFSAAAKKLFISQPSLSANVRRVETRIGYPIFDRSTKPLVLTECGQHYIRCVEQIMAIEEDFGNYLNDWGELKTGDLRLGGSSLYSAQVLPTLIRRFSRKFPGVRVVFIEGNSVKLQSMLQTGDLDIIIDNFVLDPLIYDRIIYKEERLFLAVPKKLTINEQLEDYQIPAEAISDGRYLREEFPAVPLAKFRFEPFIVLKPENDTGKRGVMLCQNAGFTPEVLFELDQQMTSYQITLSGMGVSFLSDTLISKIESSEKVVYYPLDPAASTRQLCFYWKHGRYCSRAMQEFLRTVEENK